MEPDYRYQNRQQNFNSAPAPVQQPVEVKKKKGCPIAVVIICLILAIGGVGFGIFEMLTINNINQTPETPDSEMSKCDCNCEYSKNDEKENNEIKTNPEEIEVKSNDYIYIGDFGLKINKAGFEIDKYEFYNGYPQAASTIYILFKSENTAECSNYMLDTPQGTVCNKIAISEAGNIDTASLDDRQKLIQIGDTNFLIGFPFGGTTDEFEEHFTNPDTYSKI